MAAPILKLTEGHCVVPVSFLMALVEAARQATYMPPPGVSQLVQEAPGGGIPTVESPDEASTAGSPFMGMQYGAYEAASEEDLAEIAKQLGMDDVDDDEEEDEDES